jgi:transposase-like protein
MTNNNDTAPLSLLANEAGYDPIEDRLRENIRATIESVFEEELAAFLGHCRYDRGTAKLKGYRHGHPLPDRRMEHSPLGENAS